MDNSAIPTPEELDLIARSFWPVAKKGEGECWPWPTSLPKRYGQLAGWVYDILGTTVASRVAWILTHGPIPSGLLVLHRCDNPPCVNPDHLFLGNHADNTADMMRKGRGPRFKRCALRIIHTKTETRVWKYGKLVSRRPRTPPQQEN